MADSVSEIKAALERLIAQKIGAMEAQKGAVFGPQVGALNNPLGAVGTQGQAQVFATGYDGTNTILAFTWDQSVWDGDDVWTE